MPRPLDPPAEVPRIGVLQAVLAYGIWGFAPAYWKLVSDFSALELLAWRVLWGMAVGAIVVVAARALGDVGRVLRSPRALAGAALAALLIGTNWLVFIHAVHTGRILATSLGYYINPLVNVLFGMLLLREGLSRAQAIAVTLAAVGVAVQTWSLGELPWISLVLAGSFALYGLVRKLAPAPPLAGFWVETLLLAPLALLFLHHLEAAGRGDVLDATPAAQALVAASGLLTAAPLVAFASAARRLPLSVLGMFQYLAPTLAFALAVAFYGEAFTPGHGVSFACVWLALALLTWDVLQRRPRLRPAGAPPALAPLEAARLAESDE